MSRIAGLVVVQHVLVPGPRTCVFRADFEDGRRRRLVATDVCRAPRAGECWEIAGTEVDHPLHGRQVHVGSMTPARPQGALLRALLAGDRFPGVGEATANRLWNAFGADLHRLLVEEDRPALEAALGDTERARGLVDTILAEWPLIEGEPELLAWCDRHGVSGRVAGKALACYGADARRLIEEDPYRLLAFAGWRVVDGIARATGIAADDPRRCVAGIEAALYDYLKGGSTLMAAEALEKAAQRLLGLPEVLGHIDKAKRLRAIVRREGGWQAAGPAMMEEAVAERVASSLSRPPAPPSLLPLPGVVAGVALNTGQRAAVAMAMTERVSLLVGGAGTGKTTVLRAIAEAAEAAGVHVEMMALAGRAALRVRESTGRQARTIAGWLNLLDRGKLDLGPAPLIVMDEASMVDLGSLHRIMRGAPDDARFLLVGDDGQLPPVGFGLTLHALLDVPEIPRVVLTEVMRQAAETGIPAFAMAVREGRLPDLPAFDASDDVGVSMAACGEGDVVETAVAIRRSLPQSQIVGSIKGTVDLASGGIVAMNAALHRAWIDARGLSDDRFVPDEPVMWTVNDYDLDLWNGSLGRVRGWDDGGLAVAFDEGERVIPEELLHHLELAWAVTTHKAQGSSFDAVVVPVSRSRILDRTLLYTAFTRARRRVILVGDPAIIREAIARPPSANRRATHMAGAVREALRAMVAREAA